MTRLPWSGPKKPPGCRPPVIAPKVEFGDGVGKLHTSDAALKMPFAPVATTVAFAGQPAFGLAKCGVFVKLIASALTCSANRSVNLSSRATLKFTAKYPGPRNSFRFVLP